jgi:hypothetical protein
MCLWPGLVVDTRYIPELWAKVIAEANREHPFKVINMHQTFFKDFFPAE